MPTLPMESGGRGLGFESELLEQFLVGVGDGWIHLSCQIIEKFPWGFYLVNICVRCELVICSSYISYSIHLDPIRDARVRWVSYSPSS